MRFHVASNDAGRRLDNYLVAVAGKMGLRGWRRHIEAGLVYVNGARARAGRRLRAEDEIEISEARPPEQGPEAVFLDRQDDYLFFYKPCGLHSSALAGGIEDSFESQLERLRGRASLRDQILPLQRLDHGTEGIICAAASANAANSYRRAERAGQCRKHYLAVLDGILEDSLTVKNRLSTNGGRIVRVCPEEATEAGWTRLEPLWIGRVENYEKVITVAHCFLRAGSRHQIRAHAAAAALPLLGDSLYGGHAYAKFMLAHCRIEFPDHDFRYLAPDSPFTRLGFAPDASAMPVIQGDRLKIRQFS